MPKISRAVSTQSRHRVGADTVPTSSISRDTRTSAPSTYDRRMTMAHWSPLNPIDKSLQQTALPE